MKRKIDKRNLNTKIALASAFKELSKTKSMNKITVSDVIKYSGYNRNTFYYHFNDIYELIEWTIKEEAKKITIHFDHANLKEFLEILFQYIEENKHLLASAYNSFGRDLLKKIIHPYFYKILNTVILEKTKEQKININENYKNFLIEFYSEAIASSMIKFFDGTKSITKEEILEFLLTLNELIPNMIMDKRN